MNNLIWRHVFKFCFSSNKINLALMILCCQDSSCFLRSSIFLYFFLGGTRKKYKEVEHLRLQEESRQQRIISAKILLLLLLKQNLKTGLHIRLNNSFYVSIVAPDWSKLSGGHGATSVGQVINLYCLNLYFMQKLGYQLFFCSPF